MLLDAIRAEASESESEAEEEEEDGHSDSDGNGDSDGDASDAASTSGFTCVCSVSPWNGKDAEARMADHLRGTNYIDGRVIYRHLRAVKAEFLEEEGEANKGGGVTIWFCFPQKRTAFSRGEVGEVDRTCLQCELLQTQRCSMGGRQCATNFLSA
jgi:hypothetical protein